MPTKPRDVNADDKRQLRHPSQPPRQQELGVSLQFDLLLHTFLDHFDILDYLKEDDQVRGTITRLLQDLYRTEDAGCVLVITDINLAEESRTPTVVEYFARELDAAWPYPVNVKEPSSPAHPDFNIRSGCGIDCKDAIDAAADALKHVRKAFGDDRKELETAIIHACAEVVRCYVYG